MHPNVLHNTNLIRLHEHYTSEVWSYWTNFLGCERRDVPKVFRFDVQHVAWVKSQRKSSVKILQASSPQPYHEKYHCWDVASNFVIYNTEMACLSSVSCICCWCLTFSFAVWACSHMSLPALFGFIYNNYALTSYHLHRRICERLKAKIYI